MENLPDLYATNKSEYKIRSKTLPKRADSPVAYDNLTPKVKNLVLKYGNNAKLSLDAGCGKGLYFDLFKSELVGVDLDLNSLRTIKNAVSDKVYLVYADLKYPPFREEIFDFVLCSQVIEHFSEEEGKKVIREFERIVKPFGIMELDTPNTNFIQGNLRKILHIHWASKRTPNPLQRHLSFWTKEKLEFMGFIVKGCLSHWGRRLVPKFIGDLYDFLFEDVPSLTGTLIAIKYLTWKAKH